MSAGAWLPARSMSMTCSAKPDRSSRGAREVATMCARSALQPAVTLEPRRAPRRPRPRKSTTREGWRWRREGAGSVRPHRDGDGDARGLAVVTYPDGVKRVDPGWLAWAGLPTRTDLPPDRVKRFNSGIGSASRRRAASTVPPGTMPSLGRGSAVGRASSTASSASISLACRVGFRMPDVSVDRRQISRGSRQSPRNRRAVARASGDGLPRRPRRKHTTSWWPSSSAPPSRRSCAPIPPSSPRSSWTGASVSAWPRVRSRRRRPSSARSAEAKSVPPVRTLQASARRRSTP